MQTANHVIIHDVSEEEYNRYAVVKPPSEWMGDHEKFTRVIVDSRTRNLTLFPNPNDYEILFDDDINDVISAQLIYIDVPFSNYLVNTNFNTLAVTYNGSNYTIVLDTGDYDLDSFKTHLQAKLDTSLGSGAITVASITKLDAFTFTGLAPFTFKFVNQTNTLAMLLGFRTNKDYTATGTGPYVLQADFRRNFEYNNYLILDIDQFDILKSSDKDLNKSFAIIPQKYADMNIADYFNYIKNFSPPIPRVTKLRIRFYDRFGNLYDFQNRDHHFEMLLKSHRQRRKYGNIFAN